jgi:hypothetical protein
MKLIDEFIMSSTWKKDTEEQRDLASWRLVLAEDSLSGSWTPKEWKRPMGPVWERGKWKGYSRREKKGIFYTQKRAKRIARLTREARRREDEVSGEKREKQGGRKFGSYLVGL